jgi:hypothetical protein
MLPLRGVIHTSPLSKGFIYITTLCTATGYIFPQAESLVYHQPMGIALGVKAEWLLAPCRGSIQSYEVDDMLPLRGVIHTSPLSKGFIYITTLSTATGYIFPQAEGLVYHQPMGITLGVKAEWLLTPCKGSIYSYG